MLSHLRSGGGERSQRGGRRLEAAAVQEAVSQIAIDWATTLHWATMRCPTETTAHYIFVRPVSLRGGSRTICSASENW